ncbi:MAG: glycosyltransferase family 4 protein [Bacteroidetes bacterium]|nr:glycosyltransferase family 4 protein [Bacteroidota bacterium]
MKIAINTRLLISDKLEGIGWFCFETLTRITKQHPEHEFYFIFDRAYDTELNFASNVKAIVISPQARHPLLYLIWFELRLPIILKQIKADLFLSPDGYLSLMSSVKQIAVFHDLNFEHYPNDLPRIEMLYYTHFFPRYAKKACRIITVSSYSKRDITETYKIVPEKIDVALNGVGEIFMPISLAEKALCRKTFTQGIEYFIYVGSIHPRKNLTNLFLAFDLFKKRTHLPNKMVIVGNKKWWTSEINRVYEQLRFKDDVIFLGRQETSVLHHLLASAEALTYVSYHEGFGIPILEAFASGTAVITSNITSMPEVAGDAALLINPFSPESIAEAMESIYREKGLKEQLIAKGLERVKLFSWQQTADRVWHSIEKSLNL